MAQVAQQGLEFKQQCHHQKKDSKIYQNFSTDRLAGRQNPLLTPKLMTQVEIVLFIELNIMQNYLKQ
jgi:hypothetical protein